MSQYYAPFVSRRLNESVVIDSLAKYLLIRLVFTSLTVKICCIHFCLAYSEMPMLLVEVSKEKPANKKKRED